MKPKWPLNELKLIWTWDFWTSNSILEYCFRFNNSIHGFRWRKIAKFGTQSMKISNWTVLAIVLKGSGVTRKVYDPKTESIRSLCGKNTIFRLQVHVYDNHITISKSIRSWGHISLWQEKLVKISLCKMYPNK